MKEIEAQVTEKDGIISFLTSQLVTNQFCYPTQNKNQFWEPRKMEKMV